MKESTLPYLLFIYYLFLRKTCYLILMFLFTTHIMFYNLLYDKRGRKGTRWEKNCRRKTISTFKQQINYPERAHTHKGD